MTCIYSRAIAFDTANDGLTTVGAFTTLRFLDLWCFMSWDENYFFLAYKNDLYAFSGLNSLRTKNRYPIPHGDFRLLAKRITCEFQSRLARFRQLSFSLDGIYFHITLDYCESVCLGYSLDLLYNAWPKATGDPSIMAVGKSSLDYIQTLAKSSKPTSRPQVREGHSSPAMPNWWERDNYGYGSGNGNNNERGKNNNQQNNIQQNINNYQNNGSGNGGGGSSSSTSALANILAASITRIIRKAFVKQHQQKAFERCGRSSKNALRHHHRHRLST